MGRQRLLVRWHQYWSVFLLSFLVHIHLPYISGAYIFGISVYATVTVPAVHNIVDPVPENDNPQEKLASIQVLAAGNVIIAVCLGAILLLQVRCLLLIRFPFYLCIHHGM